MVQNVPSRISTVRSIHISVVPGIIPSSYGISPSMSRRGNPYDNAMAENFFSILKCECIYRRKPQTRAQTRKIINEFIWFYNHVRLQTATSMPPLEMRAQAVS